jgi:phosphomevalonate kinase
MKVSVPGKVLLLGEYAVTEGATALVAAVDRRARGAWVDAPPPPSPVVAAVLAEARARGDSLPGDAGGVLVDTAAFHDARGQKLGLGSSAAVAVAAALLVARGVHARAEELALAGHRAAAGGRGSGVDVAACLHGGVLAAARQPGALERLAPGCDGLALGLVYVGESASTVGLLDACRRSPRWTHWMGVLGPLAAEGIAAWRAQDGARFVAAVGAYGRAMEALGRDAGAPIVTDTMHRIMEGAEAAGGAAKPSGAGGGDVVLVVSRDVELAPRLARETGTVLVPAAIDPRGASVER